MAYEDYRWKICARGTPRFTNKTVCEYRHGPGQPECGTELALDTRSDLCNEAALGHGPGHQSTTRCDVTGEHSVHHCIFGGFRQEAWWRGEGLTMSGFFDEPPVEDEEEECVFCGEKRGPDQFEDGLRCKLCAEEQDT